MFPRQAIHRQRLLDMILHPVHQPAKPFLMAPTGHPDAQRQSCQRAGAALGDGQEVSRRSGDRMEQLLVRAGAAQQDPDAAGMAQHHRPDPQRGNVCAVVSFGAVVFDDNWRQLYGHALGLYTAHIAYDTS